MEGVIKTDFEKIKLTTGIDIVSFLAETNIFPSKGEARKTIQGGGVSINRKKVDNIEMKIDTSLLLHEKYILVQKGKKNLPPGKIRLIYSPFIVFHISSATNWFPFAFRCTLSLVRIPCSLFSVLYCLL